MLCFVTSGQGDGVAFSKKKGESKLVRSPNGFFLAAEREEKGENIREADAWHAVRFAKVLTEDRGSQEGRGDESGEGEAHSWIWILGFGGE